MEIAKIVYTSSVGSCNARFGTLCDACVSSSVADEDTLLRRALFRDMLCSVVTIRGGIDEMVVGIRNVIECGRERVGANAMAAI
jgi:hypothetical protein